MTELTWLINYLVYILFGAILKKNTNKKTRSRCGSLRRSKKYQYARIFLSVYEKIVIFFCRFFLVVFAVALVAFTHNSKKPPSPKKIFIMPGHYKKILPAQQPIRSVRTIVRSHIKKVE